MARQRFLTRLDLIPETVAGRDGWVAARWQRSDGSKGDAHAFFLPRGSTGRWYIDTLLVEVPTGELLRDVPLARIETAANSDPEIHAWIEKGASLETVEHARRAAKRTRLARPSTHQLDDGFYERVATAYRDAVARGLPPAKTLAEDADTPPSTVNRWIGQARKRGHLPRGEPGKVTA